MMKRLTCFILVMLCILGAISAAAPERKGVQKKEIKIQGGYDTVSSINVKPIPAQTESYKLGMPFSLDDLSIRYKSGYKGRLIANWNVLTNHDFTIKIFAEQLHNYSENGAAVYEFPLGYILTFVYNLSFNSGKKPIDYRDLTFTVEIPAGKDDPRVATSKDINLLEGYPYDPKSLVGSADGEIYFSLDQPTTAIRFDSGGYINLPDGNYSAQVFVVLQIK